MGLATGAKRVHMLAPMSKERFSGQAESLPKEDLDFFWGMVTTTVNSTWLYSKAPRVAGIGIEWRISPSRFPYCEAIGRRLRVERNGAPGYLE